MSAIPPLAVAVFALRFRASFTSDTLIYRRWGKTLKASYSEISRIEITNVTPITKQAIGALLIMKNGERLPFWPKLFPTQAVDRFFQLAPTPVAQIRTHR